MAKQDKTPLTPARQKASRKYYEKNSATISNKNKIDRIEKEIQFNLVRQGTTKAQQHFLRKMLLDQFAVVSLKYLTNTSIHAARRDLYQVCYIVASHLLVNKDVLIKGDMSPFVPIPISQFPGAEHFFSNEKIDTEVLAAHPGVLVLQWFAGLGNQGWQLIRPCLVAFGSLLATFHDGFEGKAVPVYELKDYNASAFTS